MNLTLDEAYSLSVKKWEAIIELLEKGKSKYEAYSDVVTTPPFDHLMYGCGYCGYFRPLNEGNCGVCPLIFKGLRCWDKGHPFYKFEKSESPRTTLRYAKQLLKLIKDTKPELPC